MANEVTTDIVFCSKDDKALRGLRYRLKEVLGGDTWTSLSTVLNSFKSETHTDFETPENDSTVVNGAVVSVVQSEGDEYYFSIYQADRGSYNVDSWKDFLSKYNNKIKLYYQAVEPGMEIYCTNDAEGKFFSARYHISMCLPDIPVFDMYQPETLEMDYDYDFDTIEEVFDFFYRITDKTFHSLDEVSSYIEGIIAEYDGGKEDYWFSICSYTITE